MTPDMSAICSCVPCNLTYDVPIFACQKIIPMPSPIGDRTAMPQCMLATALARAVSCDMSDFVRYMSCTRALGGIYAPFCDICDIGFTARRTLEPQVQGSIHSDQDPGITKGNSYRAQHGCVGQRQVHCGHTTVKSSLSSASHLSWSQG